MSSTTVNKSDLDHADKLARQLSAALAARRIYDRTHSRIRQSAHDFLSLLNAYLGARGGHTPFRLIASGGVLSYEGIPLGQGHASRAHLARALELRECGGLAFSGKTTESSFGGLLEWLNERTPKPTRRGYTGIDVLPLNAGSHAGEGGTGVHNDNTDKVPAEFRLPHRIHESAASVLEHIMDDLRAGRDMDFKEIVELTQWTAEAAFAQGTQLIAPTQGNSRNHDEYTFNHSVNVFMISTALLQPFAKDRDELARFAQAALLHDVGKSMVPQEILHKKGRLTDEEFAVIRRHPELGAELLARSPQSDPLAVEVAYCHHMRDNGLGYPNPTVDVRPGPIAGIVQIADMFEALTAHRPYHRGLSTGKAVETILSTPGMESKRPAVVLLLERLTSSPAGSEVKLDTGERCQVLETFPDRPHLPRVRVIENAAGDALAEPHEIDLRDREDADTARPIVQVFLKPVAREPESRLPTRQGIGFV